MNTKQHTLPSRISDYINSHFREDFLLKYKSMRKIGNKRCHVIDVSKDDHIYHLYFDAEGKLVKKQVEESFHADDHVDARHRDIPR